MENQNQVCKFKEHSSFQDFIKIHRCSEGFWHGSFRYCISIPKPKHIQTK